MLSPGPWVPQVIHLQAPTPGHNTSAHAKLCVVLACLGGVITHACTGVPGSLRSSIFKRPRQDITLAPMPRSSKKSEVRMSRRYVDRSLKKLYLEYERECPVNLKVGSTTFEMLRPPWVKRITAAHKQVCMCIPCETCELLLDQLGKHMDSLVVPEDPQPPDDSDSDSESDSDTNSVSERSLLIAHLTQPFVGAEAGRRMQAYQACIAQLPQHASWQVGAALVLTVDAFKCCPPFILLRRARKYRHDPNEPSPRRAEIHQRLRAARQLLFLLRFLLWLGLSHLAWWQLMLPALRPTLHNLEIAV
ncbi:hypothetical protein V8C86DRAFT_3035484 [Haematococcus lacustris]